MKYSEIQEEYDELYKKVADEKFEKAAHLNLDDYLSEAYSSARKQAHELIVLVPI